MPNNRTRLNHEALDSRTMAPIDLRFWNLLGANQMITNFPPAPSNARSLVVRYREALRRLKEQG